ncbi:hypothetical protein V2J09_008444 [Rumex salicifolius]
MSRSQSSPTGVTTAVDPSPLLTSSRNPNSDSGRWSQNGGNGRSPTLSTAARILRQAGGRRVMRESSVRVRESAAAQIEERQSDWAYSRPIVVLDLVWNAFFVLAALVDLVLSRHETTSVPLRLWIVGYGIQCVLHMICVCVEYKRRQELRLVDGFGRSSGSASNLNGPAHSRSLSSSSSSSSGSEEANLVEFVAPDQREDEDNTSIAKHLESANTMFSFIWWIIGFYWVSSGGTTIVDDAPYLYWLCIAFLAFDVFFVVICVVVACLIGIAVCCCLPCIIAVLYAVADQEGATKEDIEWLPRFMFKRIGEFEKVNGEVQEALGGIMMECDTDSPLEHMLSAEDAECAICLCNYEDGSELRQLPCRHHFHTSCIDKWLHINATCPLCKLCILKNGEQNGYEQV